MSGHGHGRAGGDGHAHGASPDADWRWLAAAAALIVAFMAGEVAAGLVAHSLALLSDAAHMLTDAAAIGLALLTVRVAGRPARGGYTYGLRRLEILSAQANGITLVLLAVWLADEAIRRLITPGHVDGGLMLVVALAGVAVNVVVSWLIVRANGPGGRRSLNLEGALQHVLTDLYAFVATVAAAIAVLVSGFDRADAIATLVVVALMLRAGAGLVRTSGRIFLEAAPAGLDLAVLGAAMAARPHVAEVHDLHIWEITTGMPTASAHVLVEPRQDCHAVRADLEDLLSHDYGISHLTLQVDHLVAPGHDEPCDPLGHDRAQRAGAESAHGEDPRGEPAGSEHGHDDLEHCEASHGPAYRPARDG